jgi:hypothetical protein
MAKLNQIIAVEKGVKAQTHAALTEAHHALQKPQLLAGISRMYRAKDEEGEQLPPESTRVQVKAEEMLKKTKEVLAKLFDVTAIKDVTNTKAKADVVVDGKTLLTDVPATYLLFLEKQLVDMVTFVKKLPTLDPSESWRQDANTGLYATEGVETARTKKIPRNHVKAPATDKFPAQVDVYTEDVVVGFWKTVKFSGALPQTQVDAMLARVQKLQDAVKFAREQANSVEVETKSNEALLSYIFG